MDKALKTLFVLNAVVKLTLLILVACAFYFFPFSVGFHNVNFVYPAGEAINFWTTLKTWDAQHYIYLAEQGYRPNQISNGFFPLLPLLMRLMRHLLFGKTILAGLIITNAFSFVAVWALYTLTKKRFDEKTAFVAGLLCIAFPTSFYMSLIYTESLFLSLAIGFIYFLYEKKHLPALACAFLLPLCRVQGMLLLLPLLVFIIAESVKEGAPRLKMRWEYLHIAAFVAGFCAYLGIMKYFTGDSMSGIKVHDYNMVNRASIRNLLDPVGWFIRNFVDIKLVIHSFTSSIIDRAFFLFYICLMYPAFKRLDKTLFTSFLVLGLIPALTGSFAGYTRYMLQVFPMFIVLGACLKEKYYLAAYPMILFQALFAIAHCLNLWVA